MQRNIKWEDDTFYTPEQVEQVLTDLGIEVLSDTFTHWLALCPFHGNSDTPALVVDKERGVFYCNNPSCGATGPLDGLVRSIGKKNHFEALRFIIKRKNATGLSTEDRLRREMERVDELPEFPQASLDKMYEAFAGSKAEEYMLGRGFTKETLDYFRVGYSAKQNMVIVPMHDKIGKPIGLVGRSLLSKVFKNSTGLPKAKTAWNLHRAKRYATVIICEATFDAMRIHQAGYPNVIALLGGHISDLHVEQIQRYFDEVIIMTDFEKKKEYRANCRKCGYDCKGHRPGRELGKSIANKLSNKSIRWAVFDDEVVFPHKAKDASDLEDNEIAACIEGAVSNFEYQSNPLYEK